MQEMGLVLAILSGMGYPISWSKLESGATLRWIGANVTHLLDRVTFTIPEAKISELLDELVSLAQRAWLQPREVASIAGKLNFYAGLIPVMRPFMSPFWSSLARANAADPLRQPRRKIIYVKQFAKTFA